MNLSKNPRFASLALSALMLASATAPAAMAADPGNLTAGPNDVAVVDGVGSVPVELTAEAATFSVTVPTVLPVYVDADGVVYTADDAKIINHSHGAVLVSDLAVTGTDPWATVDYDTFDVASAKVDSTDIALEIHTEKTTGADEITFDQDNWAQIAGDDGVDDAGDDELAVDYMAKVAAQSEARDGIEVAQAIFTVSWDTEADEAVDEG